MSGSKRILITGISGFVGPHLAKSYLDEGSEVFGLVRRRADGDVSRGLRELAIDRQVKKIEGSVEDLTSLLMAFDEAEPDIVFHLAAQSFVQRSFINPLEVVTVNGNGTANVLEATRLKGRESTKLVFAGSSEEYGFVAINEEQVKRFEAKHGKIFPPPFAYPELPIKETNPLRPMSPYAATKVFGDYLSLEYAHSYGLKNVISRAFNHEGARRGSYFVTSALAKQVVSLNMGESKKISVGNVSAFRDWTHIDDMVSGYRLLAEKGTAADVFNLGSERANSVLGYLLLCLEASGNEIEKLETLDGGKKILDPTEPSTVEKYGKKWDILKADKMLLEGDIDYGLSDKGLKIKSTKGDMLVEFDPARYRLTDVPVLLADASKAKKIGFKVKHTLNDVVKEQLNWFRDSEHRSKAA